MKKLFLFFSAFSTLLFASTDVERTFGLFGGLAISKISYAESVEESNRKGINLGLDFEFPISNHIFLVPNIYVAEKGEVNKDYTVRLNYLEFSFAPKFKTSPDATGLYFLLGPYVASILSSSAVNESGSEIDLNSNNVRNTEGGIVAGIGYETLISHHWSIYVEGKYAMGLTRSLEAVESKNRAIYVNLGFHYLDREDLETNYDRAEEFVKKKSDPSNPAAGEQSIRPGSQEPFQEPPRQ